MEQIGIQDSQSLRFVYIIAPVSLHRLAVFPKLISWTKVFWHCQGRAVLQPVLNVTQHSTCPPKACFEFFLFSPLLSFLTTQQVFPLSSGSYTTFSSWTMLLVACFETSLPHAGKSFFVLDVLRENSNGSESRVRVFSKMTVSCSGTLIQSQLPQVPSPFTCLSFCAFSWNLG